MNDLPTIRAFSIGAPPAAPFKPYVYNGDEPFAPSVTPPKLTREDVPCTVGDCTGVVHAKGLCSTHYRKQKRGAPFDSDGRRGSFDPSLCGSIPGYRGHRRYDVPLCQPCREAKNAYDRARRAGTTRKKEAA